jgi:hypothetical protein
VCASETKELERRSVPPGEGRGEGPGSKVLTRVQSADQNPGAD